MNIVCLDLEGVLVPEIWIAFSQASGIPELKRTTRDEPDYDKLMKWRLGILREHGLGLKDIQATIATIDPMPGAKEFLDTLRSETQAIILSDTFTQFASPLMKKLGWPTIFCNELEVGEDGMITGYRIRVEKNLLFSAYRSDFPNRLNRSDFIVRKHNRNQTGIFANGCSHLFRRYQTVFMYIKKRYFKTFFLESFQGMKNCMMFECG